MGEATDKLIMILKEESSDTQMKIGLICVGSGPAGLSRVIVAMEHKKLCLEHGVDLILITKNPENFKVMSKGKSCLDITPIKISDKNIENELINGLHDIKSLGLPSICSEMLIKNRMGDMSIDVSVYENILKTERNYNNKSHRQKLTLNTKVKHKPTKNFVRRKVINRSR